MKRKVCIYSVIGKWRNELEAGIRNHHPNTICTLPSEEALPPKLPLWTTGSVAGIHRLADVVRSCKASEMARMCGVYLLLLAKMPLVTLRLVCGSMRSHCFFHQNSLFLSRRWRMASTVYDLPSPKFCFYPDLMQIHPMQYQFTTEV